MAGSDGGAGPKLQLRYSAPAAEAAPSKRDKSDDDDDANEDSNREQLFTGAAGATKSPAKLMMRTPSQVGGRLFCQS